ncbi:sulfite exporter TauE/SafE family protein [Demequina sp. NBRC 110054]|uniref:sulfite exporter TauE/SafE family protein n=1 Tax=Demequina sp. NBRC 110054 TaxID=1570343 RepID=UPI000A071CE7|nr:sulfite exporter TauE/SafE family protein [Demequina sp. NBRC 110054]
MTAAAWALAGAVVVLATVVQAATGMGFGIVAVPGLILAAPALGLGAVLTATIVVMVAVAWLERHALSRSALRLATLASVPGIAIGVVAAAAMPERIAQVAIGGVIVAASVVSLLAPVVPVTRRGIAVGGALAGVLTPIAALPGPPMAIAYRPDDAGQMRSTLSAFFAVASLVSLAFLAGPAAADGTLRSLAADAGRGLALSPAIALGAMISIPVTRRIPLRAVRMGAILLSLAAGAMLAARALLT